MVKSLLKATNEYFVWTKEDADTLHKEIEQECSERDWTLTGWTETYKTKKAQGEIVCEWYQVKATIVFDDPKDPVHTLNNIEYDIN